MIVLGAVGDLDDVFGGSRSGQEGYMSTKRCTCQRFRGSQGAAISPGLAPSRLQKCSRPAPGDAPGSLASVFNDFCLMFEEPLVIGRSLI